MPFVFIHSQPLLPISEFVLDKKFQRNDSKFAILYVDIAQCFARENFSQNGPPILIQPSPAQMPGM